MGGLKSAQYLALNPQGKMPLLVTEEGEAIPESDTIARYLLDRFAAAGPSFVPSSLTVSHSFPTCETPRRFLPPCEGGPSPM